MHAKSFIMVGRSIEVDAGVKQVCIPSLILFTIVMDEEIYKNMQCTLGNVNTLRRPRFCG
jgi:hypothetical protein